MNVPPLIHNSALWGTNAGKTNRIEKRRVPEEILRLSTLPRLEKMEHRST